MTTTEWAHLHNAALIDMLLADFSRATPTKIEKIRAGNAAWAAARGAAWDAARGAAWDAAWLSASALVAWDDMPAFIALGTEELEALRLLGAGTDIAHKALCALYYKEITS